MKTITVDTRQIYQHLTVSIWDLYNGGDFGAAVTLLEILPHYYRGDMESIRRDFKEGLTFALLPDHCKTIDSPGEVEIRVRHNGVLIGVIIDSEVMF